MAGTVRPPTLDEAMQRLDDCIEISSTPVRIWIRDDDAGGMTSPLASLLNICRKAQVPVALAVIPAKLEPSLAVELRPYPFVTVMQHGFSHTSNAMPGRKKIELGGMLTADKVIGLLADGRSVLEHRMPDRLVPVLVPPWNRIDDDVIPQLTELGFCGLSTFADDQRGKPFGLVHINTHVDPIAWRDDRSFDTPAALIVKLTEAIRTAAGAPIGMLTHHLDMGEAAFETLTMVVGALRRHTKVEWLHPAEMFTVKP